jgi:uncharacterized protein YuzE
MNAGSSQDIGSNPMKVFVVASRRAPIVEIDTEATAAYVRFGTRKVVRTLPFGTADNFFNIDLDRLGRVLGIEVIGRKEFSIMHLLRDVPVNIEVDLKTLSRARYVSADLTAKSN